VRPGSRCDGARRSWQRDKVWTNDRSDDGTDGAIRAKLGPWEGGCSGECCNSAMFSRPKRSGETGHRTSHPTSLVMIPAVAISVSLCYSLYSTQQFGFISTRIPHSLWQPVSRHDAALRVLSRSRPVGYRIGRAVKVETIIIWILLTAFMPYTCPYAATRRFYTDNHDSASTRFNEFASMTANTRKHRIKKQEQKTWR
jgi:hypothetical protein